MEISDNTANGNGPRGGKHKELNSQSTTNGLPWQIPHSTFLHEFVRPFSPAIAGSTSNSTHKLGTSDTSNIKFPGQVGAVGVWVGKNVGVFVGALVGKDVGALVGTLVGRRVGATVGSGVGVFVGAFVGLPVGTRVGAIGGNGAPVGKRVGTFVGILVGGRVGA